MPALRLGVLASILACLVTTLLAAGPPQPPAGDSPSEVRRLIEDLDVLIQARFVDFDQRFGIGRITDPGDFHHTLRRFRPENDREVAAIARLDRAGVSVALYLAGRSLLRADERPVPVLHRRAMAGPVVVTPTSSETSPAPAFPAFTDVIEPGRRAFEVFARSDAYAFAQGPWQFEARPVRASRRECLECHRGIVTSESSPRAPLHLGDTLGVVLYGYSVIPCRLCS